MSCAPSDEREFSEATAALSVLTYQCYSPLLGRGYKGRSPCADESMLHTLLLGPTLLATLRLNLLTREACDSSYSPHGMGRPLWEIWNSQKPSKNNEQILTMSFLGRLVPLSRAIWLDSPTSMTLGNALVYEGYEDVGYREATATVISMKTKLGLLSAKADRAIWRELPAVCVNRRQADGVSGPLAFRNPIAASDVCIWAGALIFPKKNAKIEDFIESTYSLPAGMFSEFPRAAYEKGVAFAESIDDPSKGPLIRAIKEYSETLQISKPAYDRARQIFWTRVEQHLSLLFDLARNTDLVADLPNSPWGKAIQEAGRAAYQQSCPCQTPRQIQAYVLGLRKLIFVPKPTKPILASHE